ncbi:hypothetical protein HK099_003932 [Clydaea vesicula]|uniref:Phosphatidate phosphatase APP1 catalytic domain-containing protein n=1 Tax=Clydaea vesicula TaxID=447962 RepID=A0AAD5U1C6_9FUNG|nr:hypothetical protein HK099_003932 [Clydaea vesicula]KAJ3384496.1 hypothetical protein HDU92_003568 [Lobulomyces angularis]
MSERNRQMLNLINDDVTVSFSPTYASYDKLARIWNINLMGWVFKTQGSLSTKLQHTIVSSIGSISLRNSSKETSDLFRERAELLALKSTVKNFKFEIRLCGVAEAPSIDSKLYECNFSYPETKIDLETNNSGYFQGKIKLKEEVLKDCLIKHNLDIKNDLEDKNFYFLLKCSANKELFNFVQIISPIGISVISDIDDTIKESDVHLGKRALIANAFTSPLKAAPGMSDSYRYLQQKGYKFHYVSAAPYNTVDITLAFLETNSFPFGSLNLRNVYLGGKNTVVYKNDIITKILNDFPDRKFILIGDSGEHDMMIFKNIFQLFPTKILKILIRDVPSAILEGDNIFSQRSVTKKLCESRANLIFQGLENTIWNLFHDSDFVLTESLKFLNFKEKIINFVEEHSGVRKDEGVDNSKLPEQNFNSFINDEGVENSKLLEQNFNSFMNDERVKDIFEENSNNIAVIQPVLET